MTHRRLFAALILAALFVVFLLAVGVDAGHSQVVDGGARIIRESTELEQARPWLLLIFGGATFLFSVYTFLHQTKKSEFKEITRASQEQVKELEERFDKFSDAVAMREGSHADKLQTVGDRLRSVEERLRLGPTSDEVKMISLKLAEVTGDIKELAATMRALAKSQDRMDDMLTREAR